MRILFSVFFLFFVILFSFGQENPYPCVQINKLNEIIENKITEKLNEIVTPNNDSKLNVLDLFCGCGGMTTVL